MNTSAIERETWLVTGASGMLGGEIAALLAGRGAHVLAPSHAELDICHPAILRAYVARHRPSIVLNCAAYTAVDAAETDEVSASRVNALGPELLASASEEFGARLVHVSTDYVFSGRSRWSYAEDAATDPICVYGRTKRAGEAAVARVLPGRSAIARTAWLYGARRRGFVRTVIDRASTGQAMDAVADQIGQPTWAADLAERIVALGLDRSAIGFFHATNAGRATWLDLARELFRLLGADPDLVRPVDGAALRRTAPRPACTVLRQHRWAEIGLRPMRDWREALRDGLPTLTPLGDEVR
jgi:dTDP-4-dehydrorhamnose reductase/4-ketoreductase